MNLNIDEKLANFKVQLIQFVNEEEMQEMNKNIRHPLKYKDQEYVEFKIK